MNDLNQGAAAGAVFGERAAQLCGSDGDVCANEEQRHAALALAIQLGNVGSAQSVTETARTFAKFLANG